MAELSKNLVDLKKSYLFTEVASLKQTLDFSKVVDLSIGDIAYPIHPLIIDALKSGADEMRSPKHFKGYGPETGYHFLKKIIASRNEYQDYGISPDEVFVTDGINIDITSITKLFAKSSRIKTFSPAYPAFEQSLILNSMDHVIVTPLKENHHFLPTVEDISDADIVIINTPHNPTGTQIPLPLMQQIINKAYDNQTLILLDTAYKAFACDPYDVYSLDHAKECVIEFASLSKSHGFTGLRVGHTIVPKEITVQLHQEKVQLHPMISAWKNSTHNGVSYPLQRAAAVAYGAAGDTISSNLVALYMNAAKALKHLFQDLGFHVVGGEDCPYLFVKAKEAWSSKQFCKYLLDTYQILTIPGSGFGKEAEGYARISAFINDDNLQRTKCNLTQHMVV